MLGRSFGVYAGAGGRGRAQWSRADLASTTEERRRPMLMATRGITGKELADDLLQGVSSEQMRAATRLLGAHHDGYWLRRFFEDQELADAAGRPLLAHAGPRPSIDWNAVGLLLLADRPPARKASSSELAVLEFAASLVGRAPIQLQRVIHAVDDTEFRLLLRALMAAAYGETH
ncbi:hypothetical protein ACFVW5_22860 [Streptomyces sp. NPDC058232]|uniref:hypothetical protein n=1 Tax=Streptomyces TaxID=1883 RepID=UPI003392917C